MDNVLAFHWKISSITHSEIWEECRCRESANVAKFGVQCTTTTTYYVYNTANSFFYHVVEYKSEGGKDILSRVLYTTSFFGENQKKIPNIIGSTAHTH